MTMRDLIDAYTSSPVYGELSKETKRSYTRNLSKAAGYGEFAVIDVEDDPRDARSAFNRMISTYTSSNAYQCIAAVSAALTWGERMGYIPGNFLRGIKRPSYGSHSAMTLDEFAAIASHASPALEAILTAAMLTAQRRGDLIKAKLGQIYNGIFLFSQEKTGALVPYPICDELQKRLSYLDTIRKDRIESVFVNSDGLPWSSSHLESEWSKARKAAGVDKTFHGIRKMRANQIAEGGGTVPEIMALLGHTTPVMAMHYIKEASKTKLISSAIERTMIKHDD